MFDFVAPAGKYKVVVRNMVDFLHSTGGYRKTELAAKEIEIKPAAGSERSRTNLKIAIDRPPNPDAPTRKR